MGEENSFNITWNNKELQFRVHSSMGLIRKHIQVQRNKGEEFFYDLGGAVVNERRVHWRKLKVPSIVTFHWLTYGSLPLMSCYWARRNLFFLLMR